MPAAVCCRPWKPGSWTINTIPIEVTEWFAQQGYGAVSEIRGVAGGCINHGARIRTDKDHWFFLKTNAQAPEDMFACEAEGLAALNTRDGPRVPRTYLWGAEFLLLEDLAPAGRSRDYWPRLGKQLAALHNHSNLRFGFEHDNYIGSTPQPNTWTADGYEFFTEQRLMFQARLAVDRRLLVSEEAGDVEAITRKLPALVPAQPASLLHGDLWGGNTIADAQGHPAIIDPAAHYGWAEAELAMTALFGGFAAEFYTAYESHRRLEAGYRERFPLYNLYHLLNHLNLFGPGYYSQVKDIIKRYA